MKVIRGILCCVLIVLVAGCSGAGTTPTPQDMGAYFKGYDGCFVMYDEQKDDYTVYNEEKSKKQVPPCSTFKVINSLIGLETKVVEDENTLYKWDGTQHSIESWNKDHTLKTAVQNSVVWYFQKLATEVGEDRMQQYVNAVDYGNKDISGGITQFWLQSSLKISPKEQVEILKKFYAEQLPFEKRNIDIVKNIILLSDEKDIRFSGKTGSGMEGDQYVNGWFIGYLEKEGHVYYFATNIEGQDAQGPKAKEITIQILKDRGLL